MLACSLVSLRTYYIAVLNDDETVVQLHTANFPNAVLVKCASSLAGDVIEPLLRKRNFGAVLVGGSTTFDAVCRLLHDPVVARAQLRHVHELLKVVGFLEDVTRRHGVALVPFLVASAFGREMSTEIHRLLEADRVSLNAAMFGFVSQSVFLWCKGPKGDVVDIQKWDLPDGLAVRKMRHGAEVVYVRAQPLSSPGDLVRGLRVCI